MGVIRRDACATCHRTGEIDTYGNCVSCRDEVQTIKNPMQDALKRLTTLAGSDQIYVEIFGWGSSATDLPVSVNGPGSFAEAIEFVKSLPHNGHDMTHRVVVRVGPNEKRESVPFPKAKQNARMLDLWGEKCPEFEETCYCCRAWRRFEQTGSVTEVDDLDDIAIPDTEVEK